MNSTAAKAVTACCAMLAALPLAVLAAPPGVRAAAAAPPARPAGAALGVRLGDPTLAVVRATLDGRERKRLLADQLPLALASHAAPPARVASEPAESVDPATGLPYAWQLAAVRAPQALRLVAGGPPVAVIDTGVDTSHPDLRGSVRSRVDLLGQRSVADFDGHGTFIAGLIAARANNGIGTLGVGGNTPLIVVRASTGESFTQLALADGVLAAIRRGARVINLSVQANTLDFLLRDALERAVALDVLVVAAAGNTGASGNLPQEPAVSLGGPRGAVGAGLSVAATLPSGAAARFSTRNDSVSLAAPGAMGDCRRGVFSTIPRATDTSFDHDAPKLCGPLIFAPGPFGAGRYAYGQGTSFAAPIVSAVAALVFAAQPRLHADQVARILMRTARQANGQRGWNPATGHGVVDAQAAVELARRFDVTPPPARAQVARISPTTWRVRVLPSRDPVRRGQLREGGVRYAIVVEERGRRRLLVRPTSRPPVRSVRLPSTSKGLRLFVVACDRVLNCASRSFPLVR